jgi:hypothetical protein
MQRWTAAGRNRRRTASCNQWFIRLGFLVGGIVVAFVVADAVLSPRPIAVNAATASEIRNLRVAELPERGALDSAPAPPTLPPASRGASRADVNMLCSDVLRCAAATHVSARCFGRRGCA